MALPMPAIADPAHRDATYGETRGIILYSIACIQRMEMAGIHFNISLLCKEFSTLQRVSDDVR